MTMLLFLNLALAFLHTPDQGRIAKQPPVPPAARATPATENQHTGAGRDRMICRRLTRTGTLSGTQTICRTAAEWQALARGTGESWQQIQGMLGSTRERAGDAIICRPNGVGC